MKVKSESEVAQSCLILRDPMDCSLPGSPIHGISPREWIAIYFSKREPVTSGHQQERCGCKVCVPSGDMPGVAVVDTSLDSCFETNPP